MRRIELTADELIAALLCISESEAVCILDSCGVEHLGSHLLIAGVEPIETVEFTNEDAGETLKVLDEKLTGELASIFTISYDFGLKLLKMEPLDKALASQAEPDVFLARFDCLIIHDYAAKRTFLTGDDRHFEAIEAKLLASARREARSLTLAFPHAVVTSNFTRAEYLAAIETIKELIRDGDTYQTNLTQQLSAKLGEGLTPEVIFDRLRSDHPAPFAAFIKRLDSTVVSASPERFFRVASAGSPHVSKGVPRRITTSPIKGTRPRGQTPLEDAALRQALLDSEKDRAENIMIVDLLRNDLGRICEYGSINVEKLCELEEHPTLFHLVSTVSGDLRKDVVFSDILKAVFPCGSITGAPKISTMRIIDEIEPANRGLSMGAIGYYVPGSGFRIPGSILDLSVAIRTMVIRDHIVTFNVGGGIVIDSDPASEYEETLTKAKALLAAIGAPAGTNLA